MNHQTVAVLLVGYLWGRSSPVTGFHRQSIKGRCRKERQTNIGSDIGLNWSRDRSLAILEYMSFAFTAYSASNLHLKPQLGALFILGT